MALATGVRPYIAGVVAARLAVTATFVVQGVLLAELGPGYTVGERTGETKAALVEGIESLESYYASYVPSLIAVGVTPLAVVAVLAREDVWLALIVAAFVVAAVV